MARLLRGKDLLARGLVHDAVVKLRGGAAELLGDRVRRLGEQPGEFIPDSAEDLVRGAGRIVEDAGDHAAGEFLKLRCLLG
jgi:hypothetical protein